MQLEIMVKISHLDRTAQFSQRRNCYTRYLLNNRFPKLSLKKLRRLHAHDYELHEYNHSFDLVNFQSYRCHNYLVFLPSKMVTFIFEVIQPTPDLKKNQHK